MFKVRAMEGAVQSARIRAWAGATLAGDARPGGTPPVMRRGRGQGSRRRHNRHSRLRSTGGHGGGRPSRATRGQDTGSARQAPWWCGGSTRRRTILHVGPPSLDGPSTVGANKSRQPDSRSACPPLSGQPRQPAARERVSSTPREHRRVNPPLCADPPRSLDVCPVEC